MKKLLLLSMLLIASLMYHPPQARGDTAASASTAVVATPAPVINDTTILSGDSTIHIGTGTTPPFMYKLPESTGGAIGTFLCSLLGLFLFFFARWQMKASNPKTREPFVFKIWWKDNRLLLLFYLIGYVFLFYNKGAMHPLQAVEIGIAPALLFDAGKKILGIGT